MRFRFKNERGFNLHEEKDLCRMRARACGRNVLLVRGLRCRGENEKLNGIIKKNAESIKHDVLADEIVYSLGGDSSKEWNINGEKMTLGVSKK